jgi:hypothetical protein
MSAAAMNSEKRRLTAERVFERIRQAGLPMETDSRFLRWIEQWIAGEMEMPEIRQNYLQLLQERASEQRLRSTKTLSSSQEHGGEGQAPMLDEQQITPL